MALADEVVGQRFGKWLVVENLGPVQFGNRTRAMVRCVCECGTEKTFRPKELETRKKGCIKCSAGRPIKYGPDVRLNALESKRRYRRENPGMVRMSMNRWRETSESAKQKQKARSAVASAIKSGKLVRVPCEKCGGWPVHAHHDDYSEPLRVRWLCYTCHVEHHAETDGKVVHWQIPRAA